MCISCAISFFIVVIEYNKMYVIFHSIFNLVTSLGSSPLKTESNSPIEKQLIGSKREVTPTLDDQSDPFSHMNRTPSPIRPMKVAKIEDEYEPRESVQRIRLPPEDKNELDQETSRERRQRPEVSLL